jgi:DNA-binding CsgD family transcriptional regulator
VNPIKKYPKRNMVKLTAKAQTSIELAIIEMMSIKTVLLPSFDDK